MSYLGCWDIDPSHFPEQASPSEKLKFLVNYAILAPSSHNTQPWQFEIESDEIRLVADRRRSLPVVDPNDRELIISCGAALFFLEIAARAFGYRTTIRRLPDPNNRDLLAAVHFTQRDKNPVAKSELFHAITRRRTNRGVFACKELTKDVKSAIAEAASVNGVNTTWIDGKADRNLLAALIMEADREQFQDHRFRAELADWIHPSRSSAYDGIPAKSIGFETPSNFVAPLLIRTFDLGGGKAARDEELVRETAGILVLSTGFDQPLDWLRTGEALGALLLTAEALGVNASYLNQPCEIEEFRFRLAELSSAQGNPQLVIRLGYGLPVSPTARRPVDQVVRNAEKALS